MLIPIFIIGCASKPDDQRQYENSDLGIKFIIPNDWEVISSGSIGSMYSNLIRLGYFDPNSGERVGYFGISTRNNPDSDEAKINLENKKKIEWKDKPCFYANSTSETGMHYESFTIIKNEEIIIMMIGYTESHAGTVTNILDNIIF